MKIYTTKTGLPNKLENAVVTMGNFDGVHKGHQKLMKLTRENAGKIMGNSVVLTFDPHPVQLFKPGSFKQIQPLEDRIERIEKTGVDACVILEFTRDMADVTPEDFVKVWLLKMFDLKHIVIGFNTTYGKQRQGTPETMKEIGKLLGFETTVVDAVIMDEQPISSSRIRKSIMAGKIRETNDMLGYPYKITGTVVKGYGRGGSLLGFPTANIQYPGNLTPQNGVYAAWLKRGAASYRAAVNIGFNPTFGNDSVSIEAFVMDFNEDLYGEQVSLKFVQHIRGEKKFDSLDSLKAQMTKDIQVIRDILR